MTDIEKTHKEYTDNFKNWRLVRDLIKGESALKQHDLKSVRSTTRDATQIYNDFRLNHQYLPMPDATNCDPRNLLRYAQLIQRASLFNATKRTEQGMSGMVFQKPVEIELPPLIEYLEDDVDGSGVGLEQQAQEVLNDILETGREGLFVDFPETEGEVTVAQAEEMNVRATIVAYKAENILDWDCKKINAALVLSFVKLQESYMKRSSENIFKVEEVNVYRVLILNDEDNFEVRLYNDKEEIISSYVPTDKNGMPFKRIPFFFIGSVNNRPNVDPAPLQEISEVNLAHYRNSAEFEESCFISGQPTFSVTGLNDAWADKFLKDGLSIGSRQATLLPVGGALNIVQPQENTLPESGMTRKERQMVELGARLIVSGGGVETAEAARIKHAADASVLSIIVSNMNQGYSDAINAVMQYQIGVAEDFEFKISEDFFISKMTAEELTALMAAWQGGGISKEVYDKKLVKGGVIDEDQDLEEMNEIISQSTTSLSFDM